MQLIPRLSEKTYGLSEERVYVLDIPKSATKQEIKRNVESQFNVTVVKVNVVNIKGKTKRTISKGGRRVLSGRNSDFKKAYLTISEGQSLPFFEAVEEEEERAEKIQAEYAKQQEKEAAKEDKSKRRSHKAKKGNVEK
jgi:large subunit ribosomal protein L23